MDPDDPPKTASVVIHEIVAKLESIAQNAEDAIEGELKHIEGDLQHVGDSLKAWATAHPQAIFAVLRVVAPILTIKDMTIVTRYEDVQEVLSRDTRVSGSVRRWIQSAHRRTELLPRHGQHGRLAARHIEHAHRGATRRSRAHRDDRRDVGRPHRRRGAGTNRRHRHSVSRSRWILWLNISAS